MSRSNSTAAASADHVMRETPASFARLLLVCVMAALALPLGAIGPTSAAAVSHLVISEVMTGGAGASDELIELYNPTAASLPLEGLELVYVTATGTTISRRAAWDLAAPEMAPGSHLLVANELGMFAAIADATYASGMAATGGSVALRIQGAASAIDAVGWGTAASSWLEGTPAAAPPAGSSLERLPGGSLGSTTDMDLNVADFVVRSEPDPQNSGSPPVPDPTGPSPSPSTAPTSTPIPTATPSQTPGPSPTATATPGPTATPIADVRAMADGAVVTIEGDALTGSAFTDGGGYLADASGGIAVLLDGGSFARGETLRVTGTLDNRFSQRTIRADPTDLSVVGSGAGPLPEEALTGSIGEPAEGRLVRIDGTIDGGPTALTGAVAFDVDDGSGPTRVIVGDATGIETSGWTDGRRVAVVGVVGQRDSTGTGSSGYRVQPRDAGDVELLTAPTPTPTASGSPDPQPSPTLPPGGARVISIADARAAAKNSRVTVRGVVTLGSGTVEAGSAVIQDATGAILLRLGDEAGSVARGEVIEVDGVRSTKSGMESVRTSIAPERLGTSPDPAARTLRTGDAAEASEALLVVARGALVASARRASSGTVSFEIDDGSGPLRVVLGAGLAADDDALVSGAWVEVRGALGQETSGAQPLRGYRVWPRGLEDVRILAGPAGGSGGEPGSGSEDGGGGTASDAAVTLDAVGAAGLADQRVGATLVASAWPELGIGGLLWDGDRLVAVSPDSGRQVERVLAGRATPLALALTGLRDLGRQPRSLPGVATVALGAGAGDVTVAGGQPAPPTSTLPTSSRATAWVTLVGQVTRADERASITVGGQSVRVEVACKRIELRQGVLSLTGVGLSNPPRLIVGCDGVRSAPALALTALTVPGPASDAAAQSAPTGDPSNGANGRRASAAGLLAVGVAILVAAVVLARRLGPEEPEEADEHEVAPDDADDHPTAAPQLTLVRVPNEHGP